MRKPAYGEQLLYWIGSTKRDLLAFPDGNTYRAVYTVRFRWAVYVLHCFQKKSRRGIQTPKPDVELVSQRLRLASQDYAERYGHQPAQSLGSLKIPPGRFLRGALNAVPYVAQPGR